MAGNSSIRLQAIFMMGEALEGTAVALAQQMRKQMKSEPRSRGATLRPSVDTPLWNALVAAVKPELAKHGRKALLARELDLDPARVTEFFVTGKAMPDAERTLELLLWLARQRRNAKR